ncbi:MAG: outer membrane protein assembly factor BamD [Gemmatimonadota bacterium]|nr:outer membrane protein assembly factor BamD [Gemmatimonadota bacterium]
MSLKCRLVKRCLQAAGEVFIVFYSPIKAVMEERLFNRQMLKKTWNCFHVLLPAMAGVLLMSLMIATTPGCGPRKQYSPTPEGEFEAAYDSYEREKYPTAIERFKQLIYKYPGSDLVEQARYYLADSYFLNGENLLAATEFERLNREFPQGKFADVSIFKAGISYQQMSKRAERDQTETVKSLELMQTLLAKYPNTKYADTARVHIRFLKDRMAKKELMAALFYFKHKVYDSSIIYLKSVLENFPESSSMPSALYHLYVASDKMGYPDDAKDAKNWLCKEYQDSEFGLRLCGEGSEENLTGSAVQDTARGSGSL